MDSLCVQPELDLLDQFFCTTNHYTYVDDESSEVFLHNDSNQMASAAVEYPEIPIKEESEEPASTTN
jgi:hypothetical protein